MSTAPKHSPTRPIEPRGPLDLTLSVPGSKSITNRALVAAALAEGESRLEGALDSDDTRMLREALTQLGVAIHTGDSPSKGPSARSASSARSAHSSPSARSSGSTGWTVRGRSGRLAAPSATLELGNAGTPMRFLTAVCTLADGPSVLDGSERMRQRPIGDLVRALEALGAGIELLQPTDCPPLRTAGGGLAGGRAEIDASRSSQYVSGVLLAAPYAVRDCELVLRDGLIASRPYVDLTIDVMAAFGADASWTPDARGLRVRAGQTYRGRHYDIEGDASSAAYPLCAAAICGGRVRIVGLPGHSRQSDMGLVGLLERMGCTITRSDDFVELRAPSGGLQSLGTVDMNSMPDAVMAYAVLALFANAPTRIENVANLKIKETDRLVALETELARLGARVSSGDDWLEVRPGPLHGAEIATYDDHRMAMAFSLAGLRVPGIAIQDPDCVSKSWPGYFDSFEHW